MISNYTIVVLQINLKMSHFIFKYIKAVQLRWSVLIKLMWLSHPLILSKPTAITIRSKSIPKKLMSHWESQQILARVLWIKKRVYTRSFTANRKQERLPSVGLYRVTSPTWIIYDSFHSLSPPFPPAQIPNTRRKKKQNTSCVGVTISVTGVSD